MIRLIFDRALQLRAADFKRLRDKLSQHRFEVKTTTSNTTDDRIFLDDYRDAEIFVRIFKPKGAVVCTGCQTVHFKTLDASLSPFVCPCGKLLNKPKA